MRIHRRGLVAEGLELAAPAIAATATDTTQVQARAKLAALPAQASGLVSAQSGPTEWEVAHALETDLAATGESQNPSRPAS